MRLVDLFGAASAASTAAALVLILLSGPPRLRAVEGLPALSQHKLFSVLLPDGFSQSPTGGAIELAWADGSDGSAGVVARTAPGSAAPPRSVARKLHDDAAASSATITSTVFEDALPNGATFYYFAWTSRLPDAQEPLLTGTDVYDFVHLVDNRAAKHLDLAGFLSWNGSIYLAQASLNDPERSLPKFFQVLGSMKEVEKLRTAE